MRRIAIPRAEMAVAALVAVIALAGCSAAAQSPGTTAPTASSPSAAVASAIASGGATASASANPSTPGGSPGVSVTGSLADATGDATPGYLDIVRLGARASAGRLELSLTLAAPVPASTVTVGTLAYGFNLDVNGDGAPDLVASLENIPEGGFRPVLTDRSSGQRREGPDFPGTAGLSGTEVTVTLSLDAIRCPATVTVGASSTRTHGGATSGDDAPDTAASALTVSTGC